MSRNIRLPDDALFRRALEHSPIGIVITDADGFIEYVNPRHTETCGYPLEALIGRHSRVFNSGCTLDETYKSMWSTILAGRVWSGEILNRRRNGELYRELLRITPLLDDQGAISHFMAIKEESLTRSRRFPPGLGGRDMLTGLLDRMAFLSGLELSINGGRGDGSGCALVLFDLDKFHRFNLSLGQSLGNQILLEMADRISNSVRDEDLVARCGGDEFAVVLTGLGLDRSGAVDERLILDTVARLRKVLEAPMAMEGQELRLSACVGIAVFPRDGSNMETLLRSAEAALRAAKAEGDNCLRIFQAALLPREDSLDLKSELRHVVQHKQLLLHYQPKVSLASGQVVGMEALVRWNHPVRGMIPPAHFIPAAEESGAIVAITEWVLFEACRQMRQWRQLGLPPVKVSVNLSARDFHNPRLLHLISDFLVEFQLEAGCLDLELTESSMMRDPATAVRVVESFKKLGLTVSLDDFGTGYSSLSYLSRFAIDCLKIDQSFIRDITSNPVNASIATATIAMAHQLGKTVVAEGVETASQLEFLLRHECDEIQGYYFSKPLPAEQATALLQNPQPLDCRRAVELTPTLLLVDDEPGVVSALRRLFRREGYQVYSAASGSEALELLALHPVQVIISDQRMPNMTGIELMSRVKSLYPTTVRVILSGYSDLATVTDAVNRGAIYKYFTKPWDDHQLKQEIRSAVRAMAA